MYVRNRKTFQQCIQKLTKLFKQIVEEVVAHGRIVGHYPVQIGNVHQRLAETGNFRHLFPARVGWRYEVNDGLRVHAVIGVSGAVQQSAGVFEAFEANRHAVIFRNG